MARRWITIGLLGFTSAFVGCTAPTEKFDVSGSCQEICGKTAACGWSGEIDFSRPACEEKCVAIHSNSVDVGCDAEWKSAIRCTLREYTCEQLDEDPCEEENDRFELCLGEE